MFDNNLSTCFNLLQLEILGYFCFSKICDSVLAECLNSSLIGKMNQPKTGYKLLSEFRFVSFVSWGGMITNPVGNYMFRVKRNTRTRCEICSKLTIKAPERHHFRCFGVFIVNFKYISHLALVFYC